MKTSSPICSWRQIAAGIGLLFLAACASPQPPRPVMPPRNIQAEVTAEFERSLTGWNTGQLDRFLNIYADDASFSLRDGFLLGIRAIHDYYAPQFQPDVDRGTLTFTEFNVDVLSLDLVLVRAVYQNRSSAGQIARGTTSLILRHLNGRWRIIHDHSS